MYEKTDGIVLRDTRYRDNERLLTVLTRDFGKLTLRAHFGPGSRGTSKAACQLFSFAEFAFFEQQGRRRITEATSKETFRELHADMELFALASYFVQVTETVAQEEDPAPEMLSLLLNTLYALGKLKKPQRLVKAAFELRLACISGFQPDLRGCVVCGNEFPDRLNITQGVLQCASCAGPEGIRMPLSAGTLAALRYIVFAEPKRLFSFSLPDGALRELSELTESYLTVRLERGFYTLDFYKSLFLTRPEP